ncbi:MAG TPA: alpha/beta hydrolase [Spirochaetota bacterium]|nr:alpha/beta hydrolase [Spirochaetota bacterium]
MQARRFYRNFDLGIRSTPVEKLRSKYCDGNSKFITVNGTSVHYKDEGAGPVLVLLHGVVSFLHTWDGWCRELGDHYRIIRLDMPGWGITGPTMDEQYFCDDINLFLDRFLGALKIDRCFMAGNSLGAYYAWNYAVHRPEKVDKLVLLDPIAYNQSLPYEFRLAQIPGVKTLINNLFLPRLLIKTSIERLYGKKERIRPEVYDQYWENIMREGNRRTLTKVFKFIADMSVSDTVYRDVKKIKVPVLMAWGDRDIWSRWKETIEDWKRDLPHAELVMYRDCGHMPMEELPAETARDAHAFLVKGAAPKKGGKARKKAGAVKKGKRK